MMRPNRMSFQPQMGLQVDNLGLLGDFGRPELQAAEKRDWRASLFDKLNPSADENLSDADREKFGRAGLLQLATGLLGTGGGFGNALAAGLSGGQKAMQEGQESQVNQQYKRMLAAQKDGGTEMREFGMLTDGLSSEDKLKARRIKLRLDSPAATGGMGFQVVKNADGTESMGRTNPRDGTFEVYNGQTGQLERLFGPGGQPMPMQPPQGAPAGAPQPQGAAPQFTFDDPEAMPPQVVQAITQREQATGARSWTNSTPNPYGNAMPTPGLGVSRPKEVEAGRVRAAEEAVTLGNLPYRGQIEAQNAGMTTQAQEAARLSAYDQGTASVVGREVALTTGKAGATARADTAAKVATKQRDAMDALGLLDEAEALIPTSTGSVAGAAADKAAGIVGRATSGGNAIAQLRAISGQLVAKMPRMEGPQSDADRLMYQQMAGDLANPMTPRAQRLAAAKTIRRLQMRYAGGGDKPKVNDIDALLEKWK